MKLQLALDRITLERALEIAEDTKRYVDVIEVGTSLIKDYGMESVRCLKSAFPNQTILADIKTMDEGEYEFRAAYQAGADIATVMGAASVDTIAACFNVAKERNRTIMIDLLGVSAEKVHSLLGFNSAIFCVHSPKDAKEQNLVGHLQEFKRAFPDLNRLAVAGGVQKKDIPQLKPFVMEIVIVGSSITKEIRPEEAAEKFFSVIHETS